MDFRKVFTVDPDRFPLRLMQELVSYLNAHQQHSVLMVDPAVAYQDYPGFNNGVANNAFLKIANGSIYKGVVWPGVTAFPVRVSFRNYIALTSLTHRTLGLVCSRNSGVLGPGISFIL